ncbi:MAG: hypothetical protein ACM336_06755 [Acidobacteriota bacterium]
MNLVLIAALQGLLAAGLAACVYLFLLGKRDSRVAGKRWMRSQEAARAELERLRAELGEVRERIRETEENAALLVPPQPALSGLNLGKRSQAIRMSRNGAQPAQIAEALRVPRREIELLLKVHQIVLSAPMGDVKVPVE